MAISINGQSMKPYVGGVEVGKGYEGKEMVYGEDASPKACGGFYGYILTKGGDGSASLTSYGNCSIALYTLSKGHTYHAEISQFSGSGGNYVAILTSVPPEEITGAMTFTAEQVGFSTANMSFDVEVGDFTTLVMDYYPGGTHSVELIN